MIKITESPPVAKWSEFVKNHPHGNIFQTPEMAQVYRYTKNYEPISLAAIDEDTYSIIGILQGVILKENGGIIGSLSSRSIIQGGPLFIDNEKGMEALKLLIEYYNEISRKKSLYTQIRNMFDTSAVSSTLEMAGFEYSEHLNFIINLNRPVENIWQDLHKPRKKGIKRAQENGLKAIVVEDKSNIKIFYQILEETYKNVGLPVADISLLESAFEFLVPKNMAKFYLVQYEDSFIGARVVLNYKNTVFDWYAGALIKYLPLYVNEFIVWHILEDSSKNKYFTFDFGGAGNPNEEYGVREFKRRFGGEMVNYGRWKKEYSPVKLRVAEMGYKVYRSLINTK